MARWPTGSFTLHRTGCYGCQRFSSSDGACGVHGYPCVHWGMDLFATDPHVYAPEGGQVVAVSDGKSAPWVGYNPGIVVIHGQSGVFHVMAHLTHSSIRVMQGQLVGEGQLLAQFDPGIGHTHYEVRKQLTGPSDTNTIDPADWLATQQGRGTNGAIWALAGLMLAGAIAWGYSRYRTTLTV